MKNGDAPPSSTAIDPETLRAYREAEYEVLATPRFTLRVDEPSEALVVLLAARALRECAFITACNPYGEQLDDDVNEARQSALAAALRARGVPHLPAEGRSLEGDWSEPSFLALGLTREESCALGRAHDQNAILFAREDGTPRLILLR